MPRILTLQPGVQRLHLGAGVRDADAGSQSPDHPNPGRRRSTRRRDDPARRFMAARQRDERVEVALLVARGGLLRERDAERLGQDTDDGEGRAADLQRLPDHRRPSAESALIETVRQHEPLLVAVQQQTADHRPRPRDRPEVSADRRDPLLGRRAARDQVQVLRAVGSHLFEEVRLLLPEQEVAARTRGVLAGLVVMRRNPREPIRVGVRQGPQQHGMHEAEHRRVQPDAERERHDGDRSDERRPPQLTQPELRVEKPLVKNQPHTVLAILRLARSRRFSPATPTARSHPTVQINGV